MKLKINLVGKLLLSALMLVGIFGISSSGVFAQESNSKLAKKAKITMEQAREIALRVAPGTVESEELEKEKGKLVYSFDIRNAKGTISEVWVDAKTGKIVSNKEETKADEEKEKREDEKNEKSKKPNAVSSIKNGTVKGVKTVERGAQIAASKVVGVFKN